MKLPSILYHGLPTSVLETVMTEGLRTDASRCMQAAVYLTNDYSVAENYAGMHGHDGAGWTVLAIDIK